jgi:hypothetical protein
MKPDQWLASRTVDRWLASRKEAALKIDPETADVYCEVTQIFDPYAVLRDLDPQDYYELRKMYFARAPGSDVWVLFSDLPKEVRERLWELHRSKFLVGW